MDVNSMPRLNNSNKNKWLFSLNLGGNDRSAWLGLSLNLSLDFAKKCKFKRSLIDHSLISPEQKSYQLKAHL